MQDPSTADINGMADTNIMVDANPMISIIVMACTIMADIINGQYHYGQCILATVAQGRAPTKEIWVQDPSVAC